MQVWINVINVVRRHFSAQRDLAGHIEAARDAAAKMGESKSRLMEALAERHNQNQFQAFEEDARQSRF